jgi:hypothetical protein
MFLWSQTLLANLVQWGKRVRKAPLAIMVQLVQPDPKVFQGFKD